MVDPGIRLERLFQSGAFPQKTFGVDLRNLKLFSRVYMKSDGTK